MDIPNCRCSPAQKDFLLSCLSRAEAVFPKARSTLRKNSKRTFAMLTDVEMRRGGYWFYPGPYTNNSGESDVREDEEAADVDAVKTNVRTLVARALTVPTHRDEDAGTRESNRIKREKINHELDEALRKLKQKGSTTKKSSEYSFPLRPAYRKTDDLLNRFHLHPVFLWLPELFDDALVSCIPCPHCRKTDNVTFHQYVPPRRVVAVVGHFYLSGIQYKCGRCGGKGARGGETFTFLNYDPGVIVQLPRSIQAKFPALLTWRCGVSLELFTRVKADVLADQPFAAIARAINQSQNDAYLDREHQYLSVIKDLCEFRDQMRKKVRASPFNGGKLRELADAADAIKVMDFGPFKTANVEQGYAGCGVTGAYLAILVIADVLRNESWHLRKLSSITARGLIFDHTYFVPKKIGYEAAFTLLNEYNQILAQVYVRDTSMATARNILEVVAERLRELGLPLPKHIVSDLCCRADKEVLEVFGKKAGRDGGVDYVGLGGFHAGQRVTETVSDANPLARNFYKEFPEALAIWFRPHVESLARCLQRKDSLSGGNMSYDDALEKAEANPRGHAFHYYPDGLVILRRTLVVMLAYDGLTVPDHGAVINIRTWKAYFELLTHVLGTRRSSEIQCLSDPKELLQAGALFYERREANEKKGIPRIVESCWRDSKIESIHRVMRKWFPATTYGETLAYVLLLLKVVEFNRRMGTERGIIADHGTANERGVERNKALYEDLAGSSGLPPRLGDVHPPPELTDLARRVGLLTRYNSEPIDRSDVADGDAASQPGVANVLETADDEENLLSELEAILDFNDGSADADDDAASEDVGATCGGEHDETAGGTAGQDRYEKLRAIIAGVVLPKDVPENRELVTKLEKAKSLALRRLTEVQDQFFSQSEMPAAPAAAPSAPPPPSGDGSSSSGQRRTGAWGRTTTATTLPPPPGSIGIQPGTDNAQLFLRLRERFRSSGSNWANAMAMEWSNTISNHRQAGTPCPYTLVSEWEIRRYDTLINREDHAQRSRMQHASDFFASSVLRRVETSLSSSQVSDLPQPPMPWPLPPGQEMPSFHPQAGQARRHPEDNPYPALQLDARGGSLRGRGGPGQKRKCLTCGLNILDHDEAAKAECKRRKHEARD